MAVCDPGETPDIPGLAFIRLIGRGTYGDIWMARDEAGVLRAVKIVRRDAFDDDGPFERELDGLRRFEPVSRGHGSLLGVFRLGLDDAGRRLHCVMELADCRWHGTAIDPAHYKPHSLSHEFRSRGRLGCADTLALGIALAGGLAALHRAGLVHRDLKPANIVFAGGVPRLADPGTVAPAGESREPLGSPGYMPPDGPGTPPADVFSLGRILYEALTGDSPDNFPRLPRDLLQSPERGAILRLNDVLLRACDLQGRGFRDASDLLRALEAVAGGTDNARARRPNRRIVAVAAGVALAAALLVAKSCRGG